ncbi:MAG: hypothetical protein LBD45_05130 [Bacteroidales bacterium]|jgi:hypothetical protein|nr:hypothetical protein [Bacteroidales bacterium]
MKEIFKQIRTVLETKFAETIKEIGNNPLLTLSELHVQVNAPQKMLSFYDENQLFVKRYNLDKLFDKELLSCLFQHAPRLLREAAVNCRTKKLFELSNFLQSLSLVVENETNRILLNFVLLHNDKGQTEEKLMKDLDRELNTFMKTLLAGLE